MARSAARPIDDDLVALVAELRGRVAALEAENARLRADLARLRGEDGAAAAGETPLFSPPAPTLGYLLRSDVLYVYVFLFGV
jgi:uncharacterized small protein (DUF1192 family)